MTLGIYAPDGSQRVTVANSEGDAVALTVDTTGLATEDTLADVLAKIIAAPATSAKQDTLIAAIGAPSDAAWNGTDPSASLISVMKAVYGAL